MNDKILILGGRGQLGREFAKKFRTLGISHLTRDVNKLDISNFSQLSATVDAFQPTLIINCAAYNQVDQAEIDTKIARKVNAVGPMNVALIAAERNIKAVHFSTDYVFSGKDFNIPFTEEDEPNPINIYGQTKLEGEHLFLESFPAGLIFRLSWVYGNGKQNFIYKLRQWAKENQTLSISSDEVSVPTSTEFIVRYSLKALELDLSGLYHLVPCGFASRLEWAVEILKMYRIEKDIFAASSDDFNLLAKRPKFSAMSSEKFFNAIGQENISWRKELWDYFSKESKLILRKLRQEEFCQ